MLVAGRRLDGLVGTPDGRPLCVAAIGTNKTNHYQTGPDGRLRHRQLFVEQGSDGMARGSKGNLCLTGRGLTIYSAQGRKNAHIDVPTAQTGNVCFAGRNLKTLLITALKPCTRCPCGQKDCGKTLID